MFHMHSFFLSVIFKFCVMKAIVLKVLYRIFSYTYIFIQSTEMTDEAFHEDWYSCKPSIKRLFLLIMMANNVKFRIAKIEAFNLSLPSFVMVRFYATSMLYKYILLYLKVYLILTYGSADFESSVLDRRRIFKIQLEDHG